MLRPARLCLAAMLLGCAVSVAVADDLTGAQRFLCAASQATLCSASGECVSGPPWNWDVPQFIEVDLGQKLLSTTKASGENRTTPIANLQRDDGQIVIQGYQNGRAFSFLIDEKTGFATVAVARQDLAVTVFGACTTKAGSE